MAVMPVRKIGDPVLRSEARPVQEITEKTGTLVGNLKDTLRSEEGLGLAANQIGVLQRVIIVKDEDEEMIELINPEIIAEEGSSIDREGCLSVPEREAPVARAENITVRFLNLEGKEIAREFSELTARVIQHEIDHLDGILFVDKIIDIPAASQPQTQ